MSDNRKPSFFLHPSVLAVGESVARKHGLPFVELTSRRRVPAVVRARHEWFRLVADTWALSNVEAGHVLGVDRDSVRRARTGVDRRQARKAPRLRLVGSGGAS